MWVCVCKSERARWWDSRCEVWGVGQHGGCAGGLRSPSILGVGARWGSEAGVAGAASGAVVVGAGGGVAGLLTGGALGAAAGLVPAVFTLGLSVPIGAALGGGAGLCVGATSGGAVGLVGGGSAGYVAFARSEEIRSGLGGARARATGLAHLVKKRASSSASYVKTRLAGDRGGTD